MSVHYTTPPFSRNLTKRRSGRTRRPLPFDVTCPLPGQDIAPTSPWHLGPDLGLKPLSCPIPHACAPATGFAHTALETVHLPVTRQTCGSFSPSPKECVDANSEQICSQHHKRCRIKRKSFLIIKKNGRASGAPVELERTSTFLTVATAALRRFPLSLFGKA